MRASLSATCEYPPSPEVGTINSVSREKSAQQRWAGYLTVGALVPFLLAAVIYITPSTATYHADWTYPDSAEWQGWLHLLLALFFITILPLPAALLTYFRRPRGPLDHTAQAAGWGGILVSALIMAVQAGGWFQAAHVTGSSPDEGFVKYIVDYNNNILGGLGEFVAAVLFAGWLGWVARRSAGMHPALRLFCFTTAVLLLLGKPGSYIFPVCTASLGAWLARLAGKVTHIQAKYHTRIRTPSGPA
jgi:hypothetical protein